LKKTFCLDTNVLLYDPSALFTFDDNDIIIPFAVLDELDRKKTRQDEVGANSRATARYLDDLRKEGNLSKGVSLKNGGTLKIVRKEDLIDDLPDEIKNLKLVDDIVLATAMSQEGPVSLITKDISLRVKSDSLGVPCEDYLKHHVAEDTGSIYQGVRRIEATEDQIASFHQKEHGLAFSKEEKEKYSLHANQFLVMKSNPSEDASIGRFISVDENIRPLSKHDKVWGLKPRNKEQRFALDLLLDDDIKLVTLAGKAGTGKTLLSVASGLEKVLSDNSYSRLIISRPVHPLGNDIGFLPGTFEEKMLPWTKPILDNLKFLFTEETKKGKTDPMVSLLFEKGTIEIEAITYMRGRSISNAFIIIDEAQNLSVHELKTIITRVGGNTKIILTGDIEQIDNSYVDSVSNGLTYAVEMFKSHSIAGHVNLIKGERSQLATLASRIL